MKKKQLYIAQVHLAVVIDEDQCAEDAVHAMLSENLEMSGALLDWGYVGDRISLYKINDDFDESQYGEGDFLEHVTDNFEI